MEMTNAITARVICLSLLLPVLCQLHGQEIPPADLIKNLGSEVFVSRENAQAELIIWALKHPRPATAEFVRLYRENDDPEVRKRALVVLKELAAVDYLSDGQGYLGILMQEEPIEAAQGGKLRFGIRILDVMQGSPAEQAGLKMGDLIISLDGKGWEVMGALTLLRETIADKKPLVEVSLLVKRAQGDPIAITVKLGKRPTPDLQVGVDLGLLEQQSKERHFKQWLKKQEEE